MSAAIDAELRLRIRDGATPGIRAASQAAQQEAARAAAASERAAQRAADAAQRGAARQRGSYEALSQARETLGVRSEKTIQKEIESTRRAYGKLSAAGFASAQEQERAYAAVQARVTRLTNEMGQLTSAQRKAADEAKRLARIEADEAARRARAEADVQRGQRVMRYGAAGIAGVGAAAYTLKGPAEQAMSYDRRLAHMANTAYAERDAAGRKIGMKTLEEAVNNARSAGGGTRDQAAGALDTMISSGTVSDRDAMQMLPGIMKASTASGADANALATIAIRAKQSFRIKAEDLPSILSAAMAAGQAGGFELKDMAKWLPQQMAMAGNLGLSGKEGFAKLAAWNQASVITSGTKDEGGNNLRDLLNELNTPHFRRFMGEQLLGNGQPMKKGEKYKRMKEIDEIYLDYQSRGIDKVSATMELAEKVFAKDKNYQALQAKLRATAKDDKGGQGEIIAAMAAQVQGTAVGKIFHNQQSLMAFLGLMNNREYTQNVLGKVRGQYVAPEEKSAISTAHSVISSTADFKLEHAKGDAETAQKLAMDSLTPAIGKTAEAFSDLASKHPLLVGTTALATTALAALAGAAGLASVAMGGGLPGGGAIGRAAAWVGASTVAQGAMKVAKVGGLAGLGAIAGGYALEKGFGEESAISRYGSSALNGAALGAALGSVVPVLGTGIGAAVGGGVGLAWEGIKDLLKPVEQKPVDVNFKGQLGLAPGLVLQSQSMQASGGNVQMNTGNLMTGAP